MAKGDIRIIRRGESNKDFIGRGKGRGIRGFDKTTEGNRGIIGPEGRNSFIVFSSFCEVNSRGISLASFEIGLGGVSTLPFGVNGKGAGRRTIAKHNLWLTPIDMWVMFLKPGISKDGVVMS